MRGVRAVLRERRARYWVLGAAVLIVLGVDFGLRVTRMRRWVATVVKEGDPAPAFELEDSRGRHVDLSNYLGRTPVLLVFYMGFQ